MFVLDDVVTFVVLEVVDVMFVSVQSDVIMVVVKFGGERVEYVKFQAIIYNRALFYLISIIHSLENNLGKLQGGSINLPAVWLGFSKSSAFHFL